MRYTYETIKTARMETGFIRTGKKGAPRLMLIHGNASSCVFYETLMQQLEGEYELAALDLRCFGHSEALSIDATRGMRDFSDDVAAFAEALGWDKFSLLGWSLGGGVAMQYTIDHPEKVEKLILQAPLSPFGFGGTYGEDGKKLQPVNLGSGAGCANQQLIEAIKTNDRAFIGNMIDSVYVAVGFQLEKAFREACIDGVLDCKPGPEMFQGNSLPAAVWPFVMAGDKGVGNTMAPGYCDLSPLTEIIPKPPILWIRGDKDVMVSDQSMGDLATLGKLGFVPGWPGEETCPSQPMVSQTRYVLETYQKNGGSYREVLIPGAGHGPMLDHEPEFLAELRRFLV